MIAFKIYGEELRLQIYRYTQDDLKFGPKNTTWDSKSFRSAVMYSSVIEHNFRNKNFVAAQLEGFLKGLFK